MIQIEFDKSVGTQLLNGLLWVLALLIFLVASGFLVWGIWELLLSSGLREIPIEDITGGVVIYPLWEQIVFGIIRVMFFIAEAFIAYFAFCFLLSFNKKYFLFISLALIGLVILTFALSFVGITWPGKLCPPECPFSFGEVDFLG